MGTNPRVLRKFVHGLNFVPSWRTPHHFYAFAEDLSEWRHLGAGEESTQPVFTAGLLAHELTAGDLTTPRGVRELGQRLGFDWLGSYADAVLDKRSLLTTWMRSIGVTVPGQESSKALLGEPLPTAVPQRALEAFAGLSHAIAPHRGYLEDFVAELVRAAKKREAPRIKNVDLDWLRMRVSLDDTRLAPTSGGWSIEFPNLDARVKFELFEVFDAAPRLHLCPLCERVYVPRTASQTRCQRKLYIWPDARAIRDCSPAPTMQGDEYRREYKRLAEAHRRAKRTFGDNSREAKSAFAALGNFRTTVQPPRRVGRPSADAPLTRR